MTIHTIAFIPFRLSYHEHQDISFSHVDLFFLPYGGNLLTTYELKKSFKDVLFKKQGPVLLQESQSKPKNNKNTEKDAHSSLLFPKKRWKAIRKKDHQLTYWNYSGVISRNRGYLHQLEYGKYFYEEKGFGFQFKKFIEIDILSEISWPCEE